MSAYFSLIGKRRGGRLFKAGRLLTFSAVRLGAYSRWALNSRLGAYSNKYGNHTHQIRLPLRGCAILLITHMITDQIGLHSVLNYHGY